MYVVKKTRVLLIFLDKPKEHTAMLLPQFLNLSTLSRTSISKHIANQHADNVMHKVATRLPEFLQVPPELHISVGHADDETP